MTNKEWADDVIKHNNRVIDSNRGVKSSSGGPNTTAAANSGMTGAQIAVALAEYMKNNNSTTQTIAIRIVNLAAKYPTRAA